MSRVLQLLQDNGDLSAANVAVIKRYVERWESSVFDAILETHMVGEDRLADRLALLFGVQRLYHIDETDFHEDSFEQISYQLARQLRCLILCGDSEEKRLLVVADPTRSEIQKMLDDDQDQFRLAIVEKSTIEDAIDRFYPIEQQIPSLWQSG
jgi:hypothetical protein